MRRIARRSLPALLTALGAAAGCAHPVPTTEGMTPDPAADSAVFVAPVVLRVENHHLADVVISVTHGGITSRLTNVAAASGATVVLPLAWTAPAGQITITARALGGGSSAQFRSAAISVRPGQRIELSLESGLQRSSVSVF